MFEELIETYINTRYYDLNGDKSDNTLKAEILAELQKKKSDMQDEDSNDQTLDYMCNFFAYLLYFDRVIPNKNLDKTVESINELRKRLLGKEDDKKEELSSALKENQEETNNLLEKYESTDFNLKITTCGTSQTAYKVELKYNFAMPKVYSSYAIQKAFNTGTVAEDKLFVTYPLIVVQIIKDIIKGNFKKQYIIELADSLFKKKQKLERVLNVVDNLAIQDKLSFKIDYGIFIKNKDLIYILMQKGFRFTIFLDNTFKPDPLEIEKLNMFRFILIRGDITEGFYAVAENTHKLNIIEC